MFASIKEKVGNLMKAENKNPVARVFRDPEYTQDSEDRKAQILFLKLLMMVAHLDGDVDNEELNIIKDYAYENCLNELEWSEISLYESKKTDKEEIRKELEQLLDEIRSRTEKEQFLNAIEEIIHADGILKEEERELFEIIKKKIKTRDVSIFGNAISGLKSKLKFISNQKSAGFGHSREFPGNPIAAILNGYLSGQDKNPGIYGAKLGILMLLIRIDMEFAESELVALKNFIKKEIGIEDPGLSEFVEAISKISEIDLELIRLGRILSDSIDAEQRKKFLKDLFRMAYADGLFKLEEENYLRYIASSMMLSHKDFISVKLETKN